MSIQAKMNTGKQYRLLDFKATYKHSLGGSSTINCSSNTKSACKLQVFIKGLRDRYVHCNCMQAFQITVLLCRAAQRRCSTSP